MRLKYVKRFVFWVLVVPILISSTILLIVYAKQEAIVQSQIDSLNRSYQGKLSVGASHLAPFANFPDISVKIDDVVLYENKATNAPVILHVADIYVGFNFWDITAGNYDIHSLIIEDGFFNVVLHTDGTTNIANAFGSSGAEETKKPLDIHLRKIELKNLDIHQLEEAINVDTQTLIYWAKGGFNSKNDQIAAHVDSEFELNVIENNDTTYFKQKHFKFYTDFVFNEKSGLLVFEPSGIIMEHGDFQLQGRIDSKNEMTLDLEIKGTKPSFDMFIAFAPTALIPALERYKNAGQIYFNATLKGPTTKGRQPFINANFGASKAYLENFTEHKKIDQMGFSGHFTNGVSRSFETMEFSLTDFTANLENGNFIGNLHVKNFETPEIDMQLDADFDIPFIVGFLNLTEVKDAQGSVEMKLKFHDIIDLDNPQNALNDLNQAYYAELKVEDLAFTSNELPAPLKDLDAHIVMNGKQAQLHTFNITIGNSKLSGSGSISNLPAIVHHVETPVHTKLELTSPLLDLAELTAYSKTNDSLGINEQIENLRLAFSFNALGNAFTEFKHLPKGEFFIDDLYATLKHYPHKLHDFHADILIDDTDLTIKDFTGYIDDSDVHLNGSVKDYSAWMQKELNGDINFDLNLTSQLLKFDNLLTYRGENYIPKDYRHEEIENLDVHLNSTMHYKTNALQSVQVTLDKFNGKMHVHPLRFENFNGQFEYENEHLMVENFKGKMGLTQFEIDMNYYLGTDETIKKRDNTFSLKSDYIDFDALTNYTTKGSETTTTEPKQKNSSTADVPKHAEAFNIYELPFTDMQFNVDVGHFVYHRLNLKNIKGQLRSTQNHYIYLDTISLNAAGGRIAMTGSFNGTDPKHIVLEPKLTLSGIDLDQLLFKFENFGQDVILSENLHGQLNSTISGKLRVYPDFVVDLDQSEIHLDAQVLKGRLENYNPVLMLSDYFGDKDLTTIKFDTLQNHMDIVHGKITIPNMTIESTLGHMDISGTQNMNNDINYYLRIPLRTVLKATRNKIFGSKKNNPEAEDKIIELDSTKKIRYLNLNITGTLDDYNIKLGKDKR